MYNIGMSGMFLEEIWYNRLLKNGSTVAEKKLIGALVCIHLH